MSADFQTSALAINLPTSIVGTPGRNNSSQPTRDFATPVVAPSAGTNSSPQSIGHTKAIAAPPAGTPSSRPSIEVTDPITVSSAGTPSSPQARQGAASMPGASAETTSARSSHHDTTPIWLSPAGHLDSLDDLGPIDAHTRCVVEGQTSPAAKPDSAPVCATQAGDSSSRTAKQGPQPTAVSPSGTQLQPTVIQQPQPALSALSADTSSRTTSVFATPNDGPSSGTELPRAATELSIPLVVPPLTENNTPPAIPKADSTSRPLEAHDEGPRDSATQETSPNADALNLADPLLALAADVLDDLEKVRIANENRLRQLTRDETDADGEERGFGLTLDHPDVARLAALVGSLGEAEQAATKNLQRRLKQHPLFPWLKGQKGVGDKQAARLLAAIGDPFWNTLHNRPRTVSELWSYCGYSVVRVGGHLAPDAHYMSAADSAQLPAGQSFGEARTTCASGSKTGHPGPRNADTHITGAGVAPKRARGARANWSANAKMRAYLIAESCVKQLKKTCPVDAEVGYATHADGCECGNYRKVYDATREKYVDAIHLVECVRCGPKGKPAQPGSDLSRAHKQARALRAVAKELLRDLWREAKRLHEEAGQ